MEYESRQVKWYWLLVFIIYCGGVAYLLFKGNPYLYSHHELRASMSRQESRDYLRVPKEPAAADKASAPTFVSRYAMTRAAIDPLGTPRHKDYLEHQKFPVQHGIEDFDVKHVSSDTSGFYLSGSTPWVVAAGLEGELRWKMKLSDVPEGKSIQPIALDETTAYVVHPSGEVFALEKSTGQVRWLINLEHELLAEPFIFLSHLIVPVKASSASGIEFYRVNRLTGELEDQIPRFDFKPGFQVSVSPGGKDLIVVSDNKVIAVDSETWKLDWTQTLTAPIKGPAVLVENAIYLSVLDGRVVKLDAAKNGKLDWEVDLEGPPSGPPTYMPVVHRLFIPMNSGALAAVNIKLLKVLWKEGLDNKNPLTDVWSVRLSGKHIDEYKMDWLHKGWTIWAPCSTRKFCILTPNKGQMVERLSLSASPLALPLQLERRWLFLGQQKPGEYLISHMLEMQEIKKLKKEADSTATE